MATSTRTTRSSKARTTRLSSVVQRIVRMVGEFSSPVHRGDVVDVVGYKASTVSKGLTVAVRSGKLQRPHHGYYAKAA